MSSKKQKQNPIIPMFVMFMAFTGILYHFRGAESAEICHEPPPKTRIEWTVKDKNYNVHYYEGETIIEIKNAEQKPRQIEQTKPVVRKNRKTETVRDLIIRMSKKYGVNTKEALAVADCESKMGKYDYSLVKGSSAKGIYQWINKSWTYKCTGNVLNHEDNVRCFMENYNQHKGWWECAKILKFTK